MIFLAVPFTKDAAPREGEGREYHTQAAAKGPVISFPASLSFASLPLGIQGTVQGPAQCARGAESLDFAACRAVTSRPQAAGALGRFSVQTPWAACCNQRSLRLPFRQWESPHLRGREDVPIGRGHCWPHPFGPSSPIALWISPRKHCRPW